MIGTTISHYKILEKLGEGGMGVVYKAQDTKLDRIVALKFLPHYLHASEDEKVRFLQEAKAVATLNHPNICVIHDIKEEEGKNFIVMEFVEGMTLREKLSQAPIAVKEAVTYAVQIGEALEEAHSKGIVHRDIKSDNIMVNKKNQIKVMDFGLAKLKGALKLTKTTSTVGTLGYMAPEQIQGGEIDARSDIFSFGVVLFEMLTSRLPFRGEHEAAMMYSVLNEEPQPIQKYIPDISSEFVHILNRALEKDPENRYQTAADLRSDLKRLKRDTAAKPHSALSTLASAAPVDTTVSESGLSESDPEIVQFTSFTKASISLAVLGILGALAAGLFYHKSAVGSELKLQCPEVVALSKAREVVAEFRADATGLKSNATFRATFLDLNLVSSKAGIEETRRAIRDGNATCWKVDITKSGERYKNIPCCPLGGFSIWIDHRGRLVSYETPVRDSATGTALTNEQAIAFAQEVARRKFALDTTGYDMEIVRRSSPPGLAEITWRNRDPVFGHKEILRANIQGSKLIKLSRLLEPTEEWREKKNQGSDALWNAGRAVVVLASFATFVFGLVVLIRGKSWNPLRGRLPMVTSILITIGLLFEAQTASVFDFVFDAFFSVILGFTCFTTFAGLFEWLRISNLVRLYGAEQLVAGRLSARAVAASLIHGSLAGLLCVGIDKSLKSLMSMVPGYLPSISELIGIIESGPLVSAYPVAFVILLVVETAVVVELAEKLFRKRILALLIPALLLPILFLATERQENLTVLLIGFLSRFLIALVMVYIYRSYGFAATWLLMIVSTLFDLAISSRSVQDPSFVFQSNMLLVLIALLLTLGAWGYMRTRVIQSLKTLNSEQ